MKTRVLWLAVMLLGLGLFVLSVSETRAQTGTVESMPPMTPMMTGTSGPMPTMTPMPSMTPMMTGTSGPMPSTTPMMTPMMTGTSGPMPSTTPMMTPMMTGTSGPMPSMTPMMTPMMTGTLGPMPSMTPMMTMTPWPDVTPVGGDHIPPVGSVLINSGMQITTSPTVTLTLTATDNPGGMGVAWMFIREWGWDQSRGGWHDMHGSGHSGGMGRMMGGWQPFASTAVWELSGGSGMKYISVWFADAAWNVGPPATAMINLATDGTAINRGQVHQYRHFLRAGQTITVTLQPRAGDPDLYVWKPGNAGPPDGWSNAFTGADQVSFLVPADGVYLFEVHGYSDAVYALNVGVGAGLRKAAFGESKPLPEAPLVVDAPDTTAAPLPGFHLYLPIVLRRR